MLGEGPLRIKCERWIFGLDLADRVTTVGKQPAEHHLLSAHAPVRTARWKGLPRVMIQASAAGRPTFAYDVKGVSDAPTGVLCGDESPKVMAQVIRIHWRGHAPAGPPPPAPADLSYKVAARDLAEIMEQIMRAADP